MNGDGDLSRIGISLPDSLRQEFDRVIDARNYHSRSEGVRDAIRIYNHHHQWLSDPKSRRTAIFTMIYDASDSDLVDMLTNLRRQYRNIVKVSLRSHIAKNRRLEVFLVEGSGEQVRGIADDLMVRKGLESVKMTAIRQEL